MNKGFCSTPSKKNCPDTGSNNEGSDKKQTPEVFPVSEDYDIRNEQNPFENFFEYGGMSASELFSPKNTMNEGGTDEGTNTNVCNENLFAEKHELKYVYPVSELEYDPYKQDASPNSFAEAPILYGISGDDIFSTDTARADQSPLSKTKILGWSTDRGQIEHSPCQTPFISWNECCSSPQPWSISSEHFN